MIPDFQTTSATMPLAKDKLSLTACPISILVEFFLTKT